MELLPCPFCGGEAALLIDSSYYAGGCADEECGSATMWHVDRDEAIAAWNRRAQTQPTGAWDPVSDLEIDSNGITIIADELGITLGAGNTVFATAEWPEEYRLCRRVDQPQMPQADWSQIVEIIRKQADVPLQNASDDHHDGRIIGLYEDERIIRNIMEGA